MKATDTLARLAAWGVLAVAISVLVGWFTGQAWLVQGGSARVPMQFNTALGLLLSAIALLLARHRMGWRALWPLLPVLVLAGAALIQETWRLDLGVDQFLFRHDIVAEGAPPGRMALNTALALLLGTAAVAWNAIARDSEESRLGLFAAGAFIVLIAVIAAAGHALALPAARTWGATTPISLMATAGLVLYGLALLACGSESFLALRPKAEVAVAFVAALSVTATLLLWVQLSRQQERAVERQISAALHHLADNIRIRAGERTRLFQRSAERLARRAPETQEREFRLEAEALAADVPGLRAIGWVKPNGWLRWLADAEAADAAVGDRFDRDPTRRRLLASVAEVGAARLSPPAELRVRGTGAVLAAPLIADGTLTGFLVAGLPYAEFFDAVIGQEAPRYSIEVRDGETVAFRRERAPGTPAGDARSLTLDLLGRSFTVEIWPAPALLAELRSPLPQVVLASGLVSGCLLSLAAGLVVLARRRADDADAASGALRLYRRALDASASGMLICDAGAEDLPIVHANQAFERITGYTAQEVIGRNCRFLQGDDRDQPDLDRLRRALAEHAECRVELRNYRKDGSLFCNELHLAPVRDEAGRVTHFIGILNDITERKRERERLEYLASHDELTGLPNRHALHELLRQAPGRTGVILLNLDRLHQINDTLGHESGDKVLVEVAERLRALARNAGCDLGRIAGDEFLLLVAAAGPAEQMESLASAAIHALDLPMQIGPHSIHLTCCAGIRIAEGEPKHPERLLGEADLAMNQAKRLGRGQVVVYSDTLAAAAGDRLELGVQLREAWDHGEFQLHYQPLVDGAGLGIAGVEALLRWNSPILGPVSPARFIPVAEDTGLILRLGQYALRTALAQVAAWLRAGLKPVPVSVNVSLLQLQRPQFFEEVSAAIAEAGVAPALLKLEITESMLMTQTTTILAVLQRLKALGVRIVLDDFGTGYSNLARVRELPLDEIKIDRVFVDGVVDDPYSATLCRTIIGLCRLHGVGVVAEGVETPAQARLLAEAGCHTLQGYLFGRPLPARMIGELVARNARWRLDGTLRSRTEPTGA